jgi:tricorn protease
MKHILRQIALLCFVGVITFAANEARFMRYPDVNKDKIVFSYEGDLWLVGTQGGMATRITTAPGAEISPKFSPDGKWIAFTGSYDGSQQVYIMPTEGGEPKRITYLPGWAQVVGWTPDGKRVVFRSFYEIYVGRDPNLYFVDKDGGAAERFPIDRGRLCSFSPDGKKILYQRKGNEEYYWKRYRGGDYCDIWMYDFDKNVFAAVSDFVGKNAYPMWIGDAMYFTSDRGSNGITNIYKENLQTKDIGQVTQFDDVDVMMPSTDGSTVVFMHDGYLNLLNVSTGAVNKITVNVASDRWMTRTKIINPKDYVHDVNVANDGKTVAIEARGDLFVLPTEKGQTRNLSNTPGTREMYPRISPDGKTVAFFSDKSGDYQLYTQSIDGGDWNQLTTSLNRLVYHLEWSPDGKKILFGNKEYAIFYLDVATKKLIKVDEWHQMKNDEFYWQISDYSWSPDSKWICYSVVNYNKNNVIYLYSLDTDKKYPVTDDFYDNLNPCFDANGDYLYFLSSRNFNIQMDFYEDNHVIETPYQVMAIQLRDGEKPPFADPAMAGSERSKGPMKIDLDGITSRIYPLPVSAGNDFYLRAGKGKVMWCSVDKFTEDEYEEIFKPNGAAKWQLHLFDMDQKKESILTDKISNYALSVNGEKMGIQKGSDIYITSPEQAFSSKSCGEKLDIAGMAYTVDYQKEWNQIFSDAWRWYRDFFYDANMHGRDWKAMGERYRSYIPYLSSREELNWDLSQMVGELCVSHTYIGGGDQGPNTEITSPLFTGWLGADLLPDAKAGYYKFSTIYGPTEYNTDLKAPLARPDIDVKEGDYLIAINGTSIKVPDDYFKYLQVVNGQKVKVTVNNKPTFQGAKTYEVEPIRNNSQLRYFHWLTDNINKVLKASDGKVGYMHINAMGSGGIGEFDKFWRAFRYKDGMIIDVRRNSGGWTEYFLIDKLERKMSAQNVLRGMTPFRYPGSTSIGNNVVISNEYNGSDGEAFVEDFKARKLGTVVGVPSWGGLVGILNRQTTIDNGSVEQSNNAFYNENGKWIVENHGADPDVVIDNDPASVMAGKDPQLEKAIETALKEIKDHPFNFPPVPAYPKK